MDARCSYDKMVLILGWSFYFWSRIFIFGNDAGIRFSVSISLHASLDDRELVCVPVSV